MPREANGKSLHEFTSTSTVDDLGLLLYNIESTKVINIDRVEPASKDCNFGCSISEINPNCLRYLAF